MTRNEYLSLLRGELEESGVVDADDIVGEYEQHFAFKLADGYTEEEIAAKLGEPHEIAAQFVGEGADGGRRAGGKAFVRIAMAFVALFEAILYLLFFCWIIAVGAASVASAAIGALLIGRLNVASLLPSMPYASALIFGVSLLALAVLLAALCCYSFAYARQIIRASARWHRNVVSASPLPPLAWSPQLGARARRTLRNTVLWALTVFGITLVLGFVVSQVLSGALGFWHAWHWFVE